MTWVRSPEETAALKALNEMSSDPCCLQCLSVGRVEVEALHICIHTFIHIGLQTHFSTITQEVWCSDYIYSGLIDEIRSEHTHAHVYTCKHTSSVTWNL